MKSRIFSLLCLFAGLCVLSACTPEGGFVSRRPASIESGELQFQTPAGDAPVALIDTSFGRIEAVLYPNLAPLAVENFIFWAEAGYYDGLSFFRIEPDYLAAAGAPANNPTAGVSKWTEAFQNELTDRLHHYSGALATANFDQGSRGGENTSVFYIVQTPSAKLAGDLEKQLENAGVRQEVVDAYKAAGGAPELDGQDTVFGQVYSGMDVLDQMADAYEKSAAAEDGADDSSFAENDPFRILSVTICTYDEARAQQAASSSQAA
ncbi:MAG: peptidylprolyl isomerase [Oscillospiraceae bacterium]|nr:peptidylprolyl isomerase [Oscillospiraceae bacterium]